MRRVIAVILLSLLSTGAAAQMPCGPRAVVLEALKSGHSEVPVSRALTGSGVLEILVSPDGATWTAILTRPPDLACIVAVGTDWRAMPPGGPT